MKTISYLTLSVVVALLFSCTREPIKIACVGDSITEGFGIKIQSKDAYPVELDSILGEDYTVLNFGRSATTMLKNGNFPYWICKEFSNVFASKPDIIVIKLGTNDTKPDNWDAKNYAIDYQAMIDTFKTIASNPIIYMCIPVPVIEDRWGINDSTLTNGVIPIVKEIAAKNQIQLIDLYNPLQPMGDHFFDGIHPDEAGVKKIAEVVAAGIVKSED